MPVACFDSVERGVLEAPMMPVSPMSVLSPLGVCKLCVLLRQAELDSSDIKHGRIIKTIEFVMLIILRVRC